jgi:hypothetical protein
MQTSLEVKGLGKQQVAAVVERARCLGMTPQRYLKHLVEMDLAVSERAKSTRFEDILGPGQPADETKIDALVEEGRIRYHQRRPRKE